MSPSKFHVGAYNNIDIIELSKIERRAQTAVRNEDIFIGQMHIYTDI